MLFLRPQIFKYYEEFFAEKITPFTFLKEPIEVSDFNMSDQSVYLPPCGRFKFSVNSFQINFVHKTLYTFLPLAGDFERSLAFQFIQVIFRDIHIQKSLAWGVFFFFFFILIFGEATVIFPETISGIFLKSVLKSFNTAVARRAAAG